MAIAQRIARDGTSWMVVNASRDPAASDDNTVGYLAGAGWFNTAAPSLFVSVDATTGSADWREVPIADEDGNIIITGISPRILTYAQLSSEAGVTNEVIVSSTSSGTDKLMYRWSGSGWEVIGESSPSYGHVTITGWGANAFEAGLFNFGGFSATGISFFGANLSVLQSVTGALTSITDSNAKSVLTSLIAALATYGLIDNSTT